MCAQNFLCLDQGFKKQSLMPEPSQTYFCLEGLTEQTLQVYIFEIGVLYIFILYMELNDLICELSVFHQYTWRKLG